MKSIWISLIAACIAAACASESPVHHAVGDTILPSSAITDRSSLDGKIIEISGYLVAEFEDRGLWDSKRYHKKYESRNHCVSLLIPKNMLEEVSAISGKIVVIKGKFVSDLGRRGTVVLGACNNSAIEVQEIQAQAQ